MNFILFGTLVLVCFKISHQQNDDERINEGASTSREDLSDCEKCEISGYAERMVRLMMADDRDGGDLTYLMNNDFDALQAFHDEIFANILLAEYGAKAYSDAFRRARRLDLLGMYISLNILEVLIKTCNEHNRDQLWYEYDRTKNVILLRENFSFSSDDVCLCENYRERSTFIRPLLLPTYNSRFERVYQYVGVNNNISNVETIQYYIIPLSLISKFFEVWLSDEPENSNENTSFNQCTRTLIGRLKRSMQKLLLVKLKNSREFSNQDRFKIGVDITFQENDT